MDIKKVTLAAALMGLSMGAQAAVHTFSDTFASPLIVDDSAESTTLDVGIISGDITDVNIILDFVKCAGSVSGGNCVDKVNNAYIHEIGFLLESPSGTEVNLITTSTYASRDAGARVTMTLDSDSANLLGGFTLVSGTYRPVGDLSSLNDESVSGTWKLSFSDAAAGDPLGLNGWELVITTDVAAVPVPAAAWLFGSALLGLVGLRRKAKK
ncbi:MAG: proprotein convertase P-domain-containing protein [Sedimenticola sp.]